jgi:protocatechuate 3,4-dioxygenase beta subunit
VHVNVGENTKSVTLGKVFGVCTPPASLQAPTRVLPEVQQSTPSPSSPSGKTTTPDNNPANKPRTIGHPINFDTPIIWAQGRVTDEKGDPIENAKVYALGTFYGGIRMQEVASTATTDKSGHYQLKGASGLSNFSATLVAAAPGHPPAWAWPAFPQISWFSSNPSIPEPVTQDMVLPSKSARMTVTVLQEGHPVPGAVVAVYLQGANLRDIWARGFGGELREEIENVAHPAAVADANGVVAFENLLPGRYTIYARGQGKIAEVRELVSFPGAERGKPSATSTGIPVQIGEETRQTLSLYERPNTASFTILNRDGEPQQGNVPIQFGSADTMQAISSVTLNNEGQGQWNMLQGGLSEIRFIHKRDSSTGGWRSPDDFLEPYDSATALLATSPSLPAPTSPILRMRRVEGPAVDVVVQDSQGKPVRATVSILKGSYPNQVAVGTGSTDANGEIMISGLESETRYAAHVTGTALAAINQQLDWDYWDGRPLPTDELHTREVFIDEPFVASRESRKRIVIHPTPVGYVFGAVHSTDGLTDRLGASVDWQPRGWTPKLLLSPTTGDFIAGPLPPGQSVLHFRTFASQTAFVVPVDVDPAKELQDRLDIDIDKYAAEAQQTNGITGTPNAYMGMGGISTQTTGAQHLTGQVFLPDGKTPALGAEVLYFQPGSISPPILAITDAMGALHARGLWQSQAAPAVDSAPLKSPLVVALLPGEYGATIYAGPIRRGNPVRLVLPSAVSMAGAVTVGGKDLSQRSGVVHVVAEYQDKGSLNAALSIETTADAEGNFVLAGLTPGNYLVQASLDNIWMSPPTMIHVGDEKLQPLRLAIPAPGAPVQITLVDRDGKPDIGRVVALERSGPLSRLWPAELRSDGAGLIYVPTLEAGLHVLRVDGVAKPVRIEVPALPAPPVTVQVRTNP